MPDDQKHFDVARPGSVSPQHTSRPIITGRDQLTHDPMMKATDDNPEPASGDAPSQTLLAHDEPKINPPSPVTSEKPQELAAVKNIPEQTEPVTEPAGVKVAAASQKTEDEQAVNQLIQNRSYELPIKHKQSNSSTLISIIILIVLLVAGSLYVLTVLTDVL